MKKLLLVALALSCLNASASSITPIESPNIKCSQDGAAVFVNLDQERLWQADTLEDKEGLELNVKNFSYMRCPGCYSVAGSLSVMGQEMPLRYDFRAKGSDYTKLILKVTGGPVGDSFDIAQMECAVKY